MAEIRPMAGAATPAGLVLGRKLDSIPFSGYHALIIAVLALVGFIEGYDLVMTGSLVVLAKEPLHLTSSEIRILVAFPTFMLTLGGFFFSAISDHLSRKIIVLIGVFLTTFLTLLIPLVQNAEQLIILRLLTGVGAGGVVSAALPIAAELMPAQHRRTYSAVYEMALAASFTVVPFIGGLLAGNANAFRFLALPGRLGGDCRAGHRVFRASRKPALVSTQRPSPRRGRCGQPDHQAIRQPRATIDGRGAR
jgi:MFS family permease